MFLPSAVSKGWVPLTQLLLSRFLTSPLQSTESESPLPVTFFYVLISPSFRNPYLVLIARSLSFCVLAYRFLCGIQMVSPHFVAF